MDVRDEYYKFSHSTLPQVIFNFSKETIDTLKDRQSISIDSPKVIWEQMEPGCDSYKNKAPNFQISTKQLDVVHRMIILTLPEAHKTYETPYIGITFDDINNKRYFAYEAPVDTKSRETYFLCEWTPEGQHITYGSHKDCNIELFVREISDIVVLDLL